MDTRFRNWPNRYSVTQHMQRVHSAEQTAQYLLDDGVMENSVVAMSGQGLLNPALLRAMSTAMQPYLG